MTGARPGTLLGMTTVPGELDQKLMTAALAQAQASLAVGGVTTSGCSWATRSRTVRSPACVTQAANPPTGG
jgi:hypothetical protein